MTTPVDIDKLKELLAKAGHVTLIADTHHTKDYAGREHGFLRATGELVPVAAFVLGVEGMSQDQGRARLALTAEALNSLAALIAKAERVDALEADFRTLDQAVSSSIRETDEPHRVLWDGQWYDGPAAEIANSILRAVQKLARNALSPKPEDAAS